MKSVIVLVSLIALSCASTKVEKHQKFGNDSKIDIHILFLETLVDIIQDLIIPYDPLDAAEITDILGIQIKLHNVYIEGFSNLFREVYLGLDLPKLTFNLKLHLPEIFGTIEEWESNLPVIYGKGSAGFTLKNIKLFLQIGFDLNAGLLPSQFKPSVEYANVTLTGVQNSEEVSEIVTEDINNFLNNVINDPETHKFVEEHIDSFLNSIFG